MDAKDGIFLLLLISGRGGGDKSEGEEANLCVKFESFSWDLCSMD